MSTSSDRPWPEPLGKAAYHGVVGDYVQAVDPHTEGDPAAVLVQTLVCLGNAMGRNPYFEVEDTRHGTNLFTVVVGDTAMARKGTSLDRARGFAQKASDSAWRLANDGEGGLSTPEGLIQAVRDPRISAKGNDPGITDKRLLAAIGEFAETLGRMKREGNPLSAVLRSAWDGKTLRLRTKNNPLTATGAHVSVIAHITQADLSTQLGRADIFNGFGNRFLWVMAKRSKELPFGGEMSDEDTKKEVSAARNALTWADEKERCIELDKRARDMWPRLYSELGRSEDGRFGAITDRAEPQVRRLALVYAVMDRSSVIKPVHLKAAIAVWRYCEDSAAYLFADEPADPIGNRILAGLRRQKAWTPKSTISQKFFKGEIKSYVLNEVLEHLCNAGQVESQVIATKGRPRTEYRLIENK